MVVLKTEALSKIKRDGRQGKKEILSGVNLDLQAGEMAALVGPSGGGKTTLLRLINRLDEPTSGGVYLAGKNIADIAPVELRRRIGLVMQKPFMFPGTVLDNLQRPFFYAGKTPPDKDDSGIAAVLKACELPGTLMDQDARSLSIGQQQRLSLARSLLLDPEILLLDETLSALDRPTAEKVAYSLRNLCRENGLTVLMVSHDLPFAEKVATYGIYLEDGIVLEEGKTPAFFEAPRRSELRKFLTETPFE